MAVGDKEQVTTRNVTRNVLWAELYWILGAGGTGGVLLWFWEIWRGVGCSLSSIRSSRWSLRRDASTESSGQCD